MLGKLLKYDLKYMLKNMSVFYILAIFFAITTRILLTIEQSFMIGIIEKISAGCLYAMIANIVINVMMRSWVRFRDSIYKDESYLTHTLPVSKKDIYNSKIIQTFIFFILSFVLAIACIFIAYYTKDWWEWVKHLVKSITTGLDFNAVLFVSGFIVVAFLEIFNAIQCGFLGIILGYRRNNTKLGFSVLFGFIAYLLTQSMVLFSVYVVGLFDSSVMDLFNNQVILNTSGLKILFIAAIILYLIIIYIMSILCKAILKKGVNVE